MRFLILIGIVTLGVATAAAFSPIGTNSLIYTPVTDFDAFREAVNSGLALIEEKDQIKFEIDEILQAVYQVVRGIRYVAKLKLTSNDESNTCNLETLVDKKINYQRVSVSCEPDLKFYYAESGK